MKLIDLATRRRVSIAMFTVAVIVFGMVSLSQLKLNLLPDLSYPTLTIRTEYVGAAPSEIENLVTKPIEEALGVVKNVEEIKSISRTGQSDVVLQFAWGTNMDVARQDVRESLDGLTLPLESTRPLVLRFDPSLDPIIRYGLYADLPAESGRDRSSVSELNTLTEIRRFADEELKKRLEAIGGVAAVKISGGFEDEVQILVDQQKLAQLNLSIADLGRIVGAENVNLSGGKLEEGTKQYLVRTVNQFDSIPQIADVIVSTKGITPIYLKDVATVQLSYKERESIIRLNGREAVEIALYKEGDGNTVTVARAIKSETTGLESVLPKDLKLELVYDQSVFIEQAVKDVVKAGLIGGLLAILVLYLFLVDFRPTAIIGVTIPISIVATFALMKAADLTLNIMSLGGLALGIGLLVDNSIVVLENIARHTAMGKSRLDAARDGAGEVGSAVIASTLTTVAVFFPLVFVDGIAGQLFRDQALTVTFSLLASLAIALTLIPMMAAGGRGTADLKNDPSPASVQKSATRKKLIQARSFSFRTIPFFVARGIYLAFRGIGKLLHALLFPFTRSFQAFDKFVSGLYRPALQWALGHRLVVVVAAIFLFVLSLGLVPRLGVDLIPQMAQREIEAELRFEPGTPLEDTDNAIRAVQLEANNIRGIANTFAVAGTGNRLDANPDEGGENWAQVHVALNDDRGVTEEMVIAELRKGLERVPGLQYKFSKPSLFTFSTPIEIEIAGYDLDQLSAVGNEMAKKLRANELFADVKSSMESGHPELQIIFDRDRAASLGLSVSDVAERVVGSVRGDVATRYSWNDRKIDVLVRSQLADRNSVASIRSLLINTESIRPISLEDVADVREVIGPSEIRRQSQQRVALVTANLRNGDLGTAIEAINQIVDETPIPTGLSVSLAGQSRELTRSFRSLLFALLLAVFLVYLVMASQFESLLHPFVIFFSIPLASIGAIFALWVTGSSISVVVFIGLILLAGIVVNNAIVLVDLINKLRQDGKPKTEAILEAGASRLRPILMTTLTTILGLLPLAISFGEGQEIRAPMAITVIGGLAVSTLLTLIVIPVVYDVLDRTPDARLAESAS